MSTNELLTERNQYSYLAAVTPADGVDNIATARFIRADTAGTVRIRQRTTGGVSSGLLDAPAGQSIINLTMAAGEILACGGSWLGIEAGGTTATLHKGG